MTPRSSAPLPASPEERQAAILARIEAEGRVLAADLAVEFGVSDDSIRRDLRDLAVAGLVQRVHGGALRPARPMPDFRARDALFIEEKAAIGAAAAALVPDGATLLLDTSTTVVRFVRALPRTLDLRIYTPALDVAAAALDHPRADVSLIGGRLDRQTRSAAGVAAVDAVRALKVDLCILGTCGLGEDLGLRADDGDDARLKAAMIAAARQTVLLATADALSRPAPHAVAPIELVSRLVTGSRDAALLAAIAAAGVAVTRL